MDQLGVFSWNERECSPPHVRSQSKRFARDSKMALPFTKAIYELFLEHWEVFCFFFSCVFKENLPKPRPPRDPSLSPQLGLPAGCRRGDRWKLQGPGTGTGQGPSWWFLDANHQNHQKSWSCFLESDGRVIRVFVHQVVHLIVFLS